MRRGVSGRASIGLAPRLPVIERPVQLRVFVSDNTCHQPTVERFVTTVQPQKGNTAAEDACAREPIHIPGSIQPHGLLLVVNSEHIIVQVSSNVADIFGMEPESVLGQSAKTILGEQVEQCLTSITLGPGPRTVLRNHPLGNEHFDLIAHLSANRIVLEFEKSAGDGSLDTLYPDLRRFLESIQEQGSIQDITSMAARKVRDITGFDRVMIYRFDPDWNGIVVAESNNGKLPEYLDLRFPASDIPA